MFLPGPRFLAVPALAIVLSLFAPAALAQANVPSLIQNLSNPDPDVRGDALRALKTLPTNAVVPSVLDTLKTANRDVAERLVNVLASHPDDREIGPLIALAEKYDGLGADAFSALGADGVRGLLGAAAKNCDVTVGTVSFSQWAGETAAQADIDTRSLLRQAVHASSPCAREAALAGLARIPDDETTDTGALTKDASLVVAALADPDQRVWEYADRILTPDGPGPRIGNSLQDYAVEPMLEFFAAQKDAGVRVHVLRILASYGDSDVVDLMKRLADDPNPDIREIASRYQPPEDDTRADYSESPESGTTPPEQAVKLQRLMDSQNSADRADAAEQMGKSGDVDDTAPLIKLLHDPDPTVRQKAAAGLGVLNGYFEDATIRWNGNLDDTAPALYTALDDPSASVRAAAVKSLAAIYPDWANAPEIPANHAFVIAKLEKMMADQDPGVSREATLALIHFLQPDDVDESIALLRHSDPHVRAAAIDAVGNSLNPRGVRTLVGMLKDPDPGVRYEALRNLWMMIVSNVRSTADQRAALAAELPIEQLLEGWPQDQADATLAMQLLAAPSDPAAGNALLSKLANVRCYEGTFDPVAQTIAQRKDALATPLLLEIVKMPCSAYHSTTLQLLLNRHDPSVVQPLLEFAATKEGSWISVDQVLLAFHDSRVVPDLLAGLKNRDESVRVGAANSLASFDDIRIVLALIAALKDESRAVQYAAAASLGKLGDPQAIPPLIAMLDYNPGAAALALGDLKASQAAPRLAALLQDPKTSNRVQIIQGIAKLPPSVAADVLPASFQQGAFTDCTLRQTLVAELAKIQDPRVIPVLEKIYMDGWKSNECPLARTDAANALNQRGAPLLPHP